MLKVRMILCINCPLHLKKQMKPLIGWKFFLAQR